MPLPIPGMRTSGGTKRPRASYESATLSDHKSPVKRIRTMREDLGFMSSPPPGYDDRDMNRQSRSAYDESQLVRSISKPMLRLPSLAAAYSRADNSPAKFHQASQHIATHAVPETSHHGQPAAERTSRRTPYGHRLSLPYAKALPHIFIPASALPATHGFLRELKALLRGSQQEEMLVDRSGYYIIFSATEEGSHFLQRCYRFHNQNTSCQRYLLRMQCFPNGQHPTASKSSRRSDGHVDQSRHRSASNVVTGPVSPLRERMVDEHNYRAKLPPIHFTQPKMTAPKHHDVTTDLFGRPHSFGSRRSSINVHRLASAEYGRPAPVLAKPISSEPAQSLQAEQVTEPSHARHKIRLVNNSSRSEAQHHEQEYSEVGDAKTMLHTGNLSTTSDLSRVKTDLSAQRSQTASQHATETSPDEPLSKRHRASSSTVMVRPPRLTIWTKNLKDESASIRSAACEGSAISSRSLATTKSSRRRACLICRKTSALDASALVRCSRCTRYYHKGCHKPPMPIEPFKWKCYRCAQKPELAEDDICATSGTSEKKRSLQEHLQDRAHTPKLKPADIPRLTMSTRSRKSYDDEDTNMTDVAGNDPIGRPSEQAQDDEVSGIAVRADQVVAASVSVKRRAESRAARKSTGTGRGRSSVRATNDEVLHTDESALHVSAAAHAVRSPEEILDIIRLRTAPSYSARALPAEPLSVPSEAIAARRTAKQIFGESPSTSRLGHEPLQERMKIIHASLHYERTGEPDPTAQIAPQAPMMSAVTPLTADDYSWGDTQEFANLVDLLGIPETIVPVVHDHQLMFRDAVKVRADLRYVCIS